MLCVDLIAGMEIDVLLADRGYDTDMIVEQAVKSGTKVVIRPKKNRKMQREYDKELYKERHLIENVILALKRWQGIATRYTKSAASFLSALYLRCIVLFTGLF
ncbi:hypothetical protein FACS1894172_08330 [Spirochaetia bacterium]|nr:hypothetical protein FACS1894164_07930 [Spirochaetia bacterium]GHU32171.1 hypothetical protein FACS1894172_08330 [Spirochaetia bacterium]